MDMDVSIENFFFFFFFFAVVVVKTIRTRRSYSILSGTGKPGARLGQTELQRVMEREKKRERESGGWGEKREGSGTLLP